MQGAGMFCMTCIVLVVNIKLLMSAYTISFWLVLLVALSVLFYFVAFWFFCWYAYDTDDYGVFYHLFSYPETYFALFFFISSYILIDVGMKFASIEINVLMEKRKEKALYDAKIKQAKKPKNNIQRRMTTVLGKYPFSSI